MKLSKLLILFLACSLMSCSGAAEKKTKAEKQGWKLSMQSYTFHLFSVVESLDKTREAGLKYIEIYPRQRMGEGFGDAVFGYNLTPEQQSELKKLAESKGVKIISSGVWTPSRDEWKKVFDLAKSMELEFISAEPAKDDWDVVEELAKQYRIKIACHNHPNESSYWEPEILLDIITDKDKLLGSCADVGHFKRMGVEAAEAIQQLEGRIISMHFKDIAPDSEKGTLEDVVWGTGVLNVKGILQELKRQNFKGYFTIEYEANWENNLPEIKKSVEYFNSVADELF